MPRLDFLQVCVHAKVQEQFKSQHRCGDPSISDGWACQATRLVWTRAMSITKSPAVSKTRELAQKPKKKSFAAEGVQVKRILAALEN